MQPYLALANAENFLGHCEHEKWPLGSDMGATTAVLGPATGFGCGGVAEELWTGIGPWLGAESVDACEKGDTEVWFPLSSSSKGLEKEEPSEFGESVGMELFRTTPPSAT